MVTWSCHAVAYYYLQTHREYVNWGCQLGLMYFGSLHCVFGLLAGWLAGQEGGWVAS